MNLSNETKQYLKKYGIIFAILFVLLIIISIINIRYFRKPLPPDKDTILLSETDYYYSFFKKTYFNQEDYKVFIANDRNMTVQDLFDIAEFFPWAEKNAALVWLWERYGSYTDRASLIEWSDFLEFYTYTAGFENSLSGVNISSFYILSVADKIITENIKYNLPDETKRHVIYPFAGHAYKAVTSGNEIIYCLGFSSEPVSLKNAWVISGGKNSLNIFYNGTLARLKCEGHVNTDVHEVIADITLTNSFVYTLSPKAERITSKVLVTEDKWLELEGLGKIEFADDFKIYKIYGDIELEPTQKILVGYSFSDFVMEDGKISAVLITEPIIAKNIRVLINTTGYKGLYHETVSISSLNRFSVTYPDGSSTWYPAGQKLTFDVDSKELQQGRLIFKTENDTGTMIIQSVKRSSGNPDYRGTIELSLTDKGILIVNELPLEEYLYGVVPSEMSPTYGIEALKVQAVCSRSYAYQQLLANRYRKYGAHIDDSTACQVYKNYKENEDATFAVKDTHGQIITYDGKQITTFYFSTSFGHTAKASDVWKDVSDVAYLKGKLQDDSERILDLSSEESFKEFLDGDTFTFDSDSKWYRWEATVSLATLSEKLLETLQNRYAAVPSLILTEVEKDGEITYKSLPVESIGEVLSVEITERAESGLVMALLIRGTENSYLVKREYNARVSLPPTGKITLKDGSRTSLSMLPSGFFLIENNGDTLKIRGGGYGHGTGMSQYGVKTMSALSYSYDEILRHYYSDIDFEYIYPSNQI